MKAQRFSKWIMLLNLSLIFSLMELFIVNQVFAYSPPIGIPSPTFGIEQQHTDYSGNTFVAGGFIYKDAGTGPYSHYIDNSSSSCTDTSNAYGTEETPRCTIPITIPAGSVVELHGGPYSSLTLDGCTGTISAPIYIRGFNDTNKITFSNIGADNSAIRIINSSYIIIENIITDGGALTGASPSNGISIRSPADHISVRESECKNYPIPDFCVDAACWNSALWSVGAGVDGATGNVTSNIVFYNNFIHNNAAETWPPPYETGRHGVMVLSGAEYVWVLGNKIDHSGDDGVQVYWKSTGVNGPPAHHVYIGNNLVDHMGENAFDIKQSYDVVISQNKIWGFQATTQLGAGSDGAAIVLNNDDPSDRLWVLYNEIFDSNIGIRTQAHGAVYIIGNVIYDIIRAVGAVVPTSSTGSTSGCGITAASSPNLNIINNTIDQVDGGIYIIAVTGATYNISNNIVSNLNETLSYVVAYNVSTPMLSIATNLFYSLNGNTALKKVTCTGCIIGKNPLFIDKPNRDYRLGATSPAFGSGLINSTYPVFFTTYNLPLMYSNLGIAQYFSSGVVVNTPMDIGSCHNLTVVSTFEAPRYKDVHIIR
ncbi:MAG: hypothetical protein Q7V63_08410 [Gammaproteobacteria bacterium]|nr:hypothetical protein [Gammaproteobacteria bacterium]